MKAKTMRNLIILFLVLEVIIGVSCACIAYKAGQDDVIHNLEPWILETDTPAGGDYILHIRIHNQWHEYTGYIG